MKSRYRPAFQLTAASTLVLMATGALAQESAIYTPLAAGTLPQPGSSLAAYAGSVQLGLGYTNDENFMFGQYNGLHEDEVTLIGNLQWQDFANSDSYWQVSLSDVGLDTREGEVTWGRSDRLRVKLGFDSQLQVRNNSGSTPFRGSSNLQLPENWVSGINTSDWTALDGSLRRFDRELERERLFLDLEAKLNDHWRLEAGLSYEDKEGTGDIGAPIYVDAATADAVLLPLAVDQSTTEFDLGLMYDGDKLHLEGRLAYSDFDNENEQQIWQNPYDGYGPDVAYPVGEGALGLAPDNEQTSGRLTAQYIFSPTARLQFDGSYAVASQDQDYLDYTVNPALTVTEPLPRSSYDGEVETSIANTRLLLRPMPKLNVEAFFKVRDRNYDAPRDGYRYVRGDGGAQPRSALTVYNTSQDFLSQTMGFELAYRLPLRSRLSFEYEFEEIERENAAVEQTEEARSTLGYRIQPWSNFSAKLELQYADRAADPYQWDQSYYALLDAELINATPDSQRYNNHPLLSQFHLSNRERQGSKLDLNYLPGDRWNLNLNWFWRDDDYDKSYMGLTWARWQRLHFSASYAAVENFSASLYAGYDRYEAEQTSRAFRGGLDKNAFEIYTPLPQASDRNRDWDLETEDNSLTLGANLHWQLTGDIELALDYSYVDTDAEQGFTTFGASDVVASDLPEVETTLHHVQASGTWHMQDNLSLRLDYQYYGYDSDDWAWQGVQADTIGKVLSFGQRNPDEEIHYVGASVIYRWQ